MGGPTCPSQNRIDGKIVLITGASGGIGLETTKELTARGIIRINSVWQWCLLSEHTYKLLGAKVILACRNAIKGKKAIETIKATHPNAKVEMRILDVSLLTNIREFAAQLEADYDHIDILINNAGIIFHPFEKTIEGNEVTTATNYLGNNILIMM